MGFKISMRDVASFGSGILQANEKNTENNLKLRQDELKANRDFIIAQKKDKYAAELEMYKEEKKKAAEIDRLNSNAKDSEMSKDAYATQYLMTTLGTEKYKILATNPERLQEAISSIDTPKNYKFSLNRNMIDKQAQADVSIINNTFADEMKNSKGENVIASKVRNLIGMKNQATQDIQTNLEEKLKAAKLVEESVVEQPDLSGIKFKERGATSTYVSPEFRKEAKELRVKLNNNTEVKKENLNIVLTFFGENKMPVPKQYLEYDKDGNTTGLKNSGRTFMNQINSLGSQAVNSISDEDLKTATGNKISYISNKLNPNVINRMVANRLADYSLPSSKSNYFEGSDNVIGIVPFSVVDVNNTLGTKQFTSKAETKAVGQVYLSVLKDINLEKNKDGSIESAGKFMNDYQNKLLEASSTSPLVIDVQNRMIAKLNLNKVEAVSSSPSSSNKTTINVFDPKTKVTKQYTDNPQIREVIKQRGLTITSDSPSKKTEAPITPETNPSYMRADAPDVLTPAIKGFMEQTKKDEGIYGYSAP
jgi:hypothetical protein